jgi:hypothetical protein
VATRATATHARVNQAEPKAIWSSPPEEKDRLENEARKTPRTSKALFLSVFVYLIS